MKTITKEVIGLVSFTTALFLILNHSGGMARVLNASGAAFAQSVKTLQGR